MENITTLSNFINNAEDIISNVLLNEEPTKIVTKNGNVVLITEAQYKVFLDSMIRTKTTN